MQKIMKEGGVVLYILEDGTIRITRGDTARIKVDVNDITNGVAYELQQNDVLVLTVKKAVTDSVYVIQKIEKGGSAFHIEPSDTEKLKFGNYKYDVQLTTEMGDVYTIVEPSTFEVMKEVTY